MGEFRLAPGTRYIIQVPERHQLALTERPRAAVHVPVVELTGVRALQVVAHVLEGVGGEKRIAMGGLVERAHQGLHQGGVNVLPVLPAADAQIGGVLDGLLDGFTLAEAARILLLRLGLEAADHFAADFPA
jgi:hypothetical protein